MKTKFLVKQDVLFYEAPQVEILGVDDLSVICTSATVEELENGGMIDWFE